jgi:hypothetical protein
MLTSTQQEHPETEAAKLTRIFQQLIEIVEKQKTEPRLVYTIEEAAEKMQVSIPTFREHYLKRPDFPQLWSGRKCVIPKKALDEWVNNPEKWNRG